MPGSSKPITVFYSYAHQDEPFRKELEKHLSLLRRQGLITEWHDRQILAGTDWEQAIDSHLTAASVILLLISASYLASDYCYGIEMQRALQRHQENQARVIPVLLRPVDWRDAPFAHLQVLPTNARAISTWKNRNEAFADVVAGIRRAIEDLSLVEVSGSRAALPPIWNVPYRRNPFFTGREELLSRLHAQLQAGQITTLSQPQAISGLGGVGKTQVAVEYAYRFQQDYQAVLWARADSQESLISSFMTLAQLLKLPEREAQDQAITVQAVKTWLQTHSQWLLILDGVDDPALIKEFLPPVLGGHLILTTRASAIERLAPSIEVEALSPEEGAMLLLRRAGVLAADASLEQVSSSEKTKALQIVQDLGALPLALDQAAAYLEETGTSLSSYQQAYQQSRAELLEERGGLVSDHPQSVAATWSLSFERVEEQNSAAADLLRLCAFLAADAIPEEILIAGAHYLGGKLWPVAADPSQLGQAIEALRAYSLIRRNEQERTIIVHRLIQAVVGDALPSEVQDLWKERAVLALASAFPEVEFNSWLTCARLLPHALLCASWIDELEISTLQAARLLNQVGLYLKGHARYKEAEPLYQRAMGIYERLLGPMHSDMATILNNLALLAVAEGKYGEAEPLFHRALAIHEQQLGTSHPFTAASLDNLANLYVNEGKYREAEPLLQRALTIHEQQLGPEHLSTATSLDNLALLYAEQGKYREAEPLYQRAIAIQEQQLGPTHPSTAASLDNLANLYVNERKFVEAEPLLQRALAIREQQLGPEHPSMAISLNNLALLYAEQGKYEQAKPLYQRALTICEQMLGQEHPHTQRARNNYERLLQRIGQAGEAV